MVRIKNRYLLLNILYPTLRTPLTTLNSAHLTFSAPTPSHIDAGRFINVLRDHISTLFGDYGIGSSFPSLKVVYFSAATSTIILRVPRNHHNLIWAALTHVTEIPAKRKGEQGKPCVVRVVRVSGTIRKAEETLLRRSRRDIVRAKLTQDGTESNILDKMLEVTQHEGKSSAKSNEMMDDVDFATSSVAGSSD